MLNFYLYSVTSISLFMFYFATMVFVRGSFLLIIGGDADQAGIRSLAIGLGYAAVAFPLWWVHWGWVRKQFKHAEGDAIQGHHFYLFSVVCLNAMVILFAGGMGISSLVKILFGAGNTTVEGMASSGVMIFALLLSIALWHHHWWQFIVGFNGDFPLGKKPEVFTTEASSQSQ